MYIVRSGSFRSKIGVRLSASISIVMTRHRNEYEYFSMSNQTHPQNVESCALNIRKKNEMSSAPWGLHPFNFQSKQNFDPAAFQCLSFWALRA